MSNQMTKSDASRIQSSQSRSGHNTGAGSFAARSQSAGDRNSNTSTNSQSNKGQQSKTGK
ncbi:uncharacterized protein ACHE_40166S [Aspergillus chevalieri]|uniref:SMP domain-containing protein n=1 Tax=Aspergillus chevalieri TaxID=182096 RepID=A0A7R7ZNS9_ASPCH|nr:uncharacterized protein ACHE_40166S [Aspergillus chevalieri]BCR87602.1 hypothetical protein ACHE_40166S [Aspergillus chevalieri]